VEPGPLTSCESLFVSYQIGRRGRQVSPSCCDRGGHGHPFCCWSAINAGLRVAESGPDSNEREVGLRPGGDLLAHTW
jgi:hypothetical protein